MKKISFRNDVLPLKNELYRLALRITLDSAEAEDVVQETMIKVWNRREQWDEIESIEAFCLTICRNMAVDRTRQASKKNISIDQCSSLQGASCQRDLRDHRIRPARCTGQQPGANLSRT